MGIITIELLAKIKKQYRLQWLGTHGILHWWRVYENGIMLSKQKGVNKKVVQLFSIFHDSARKNENRDNNHGIRGAQLATNLREDIPLNDDEFELLTIACSLHTNTLTHDNITIQACFDSDRLDLGRVNIYPDASRLCTVMAKKTDFIKSAYTRSINQNILPYCAFESGSFE